MRTSGHKQYWEVESSGERERADQPQPLVPDRHLSDPPTTKSLNWKLPLARLTRCHVHDHGWEKLGFIDGW